MKSQESVKEWPCRELWIVCGLIFIAIFVLSVLTPKYADDFAYSFSFATDERIQSLADIIPSMEAHRVLLNGRILPHFLVQLFLMLPKPVFSLLNALQAVLLVLLCDRFLQTERKERLMVLLCGIIGIWVFSPSFGENYLWLDGAVNYCWAMTVLMLFLQPYADAWFGKTTFKNHILPALHILLSFAAGAWSENASLVFLLLALFLLLAVWRRERRLPVFLLISLCSAAAGYVFLMTAPATAGRAGTMTLPAIIRNLRTVIKVTEDYLMILYMLYAALLALVLLFHGRKDRILFSLLLTIAGMGALFSFVFAAYFVERHFSCTVFLTVFSCSILVDELFQLKKPTFPVVLIAVLSLVFLFRFSYGVIDILVSNRKEAEREQQIQQSIDAGESTVTLTNYFPATRYALPFILDAPDSWVNMTVSSYYGLDSVYGVNPEE